MTASAPGPASGASDPDLMETHQRCLEAGAVVFDDGESGHALFFIRSGEVELTRRGAVGARAIARLGPGDFFGESGVLTRGVRRGRATVVREAELLEVDVAVFEEMCLERPDIGLRISRALAVRAQSLEQRLVCVALADGVRATVRALLRRARPEGDVARVDGGLRALATDAGLGLLECHLALQQLVERRLVRLADDVLVIPDLEALGANVETPAR